MVKILCKKCGKEVEKELIPNNLISLDPTIEFIFLCKKCKKEKREKLF